MKIYDTIRFLRQYKGYSQEYVAEQIGIDPVTYGRVETCKIKLTVERLEAIADVLGYSVVKLLELSGNVADDTESNEIIDLLKRNVTLSEQILEKLKTAK